MNRSSCGTSDQADLHGHDRSSPRPVRTTRLAIWGWTQAGLQAVLVLALIAYTSELVTEEPRGAHAWETHLGDTIQSMALSPDGRKLATGGDDGDLILWDVGRGAERRRLGKSRSMVLCVAFSPDGKTLAAADLDVTVTLWDVVTGQKRV